MQILATGSEELIRRGGGRGWASDLPAQIRHNRLRLPGSTLVEVLVSLSLASITFVIGAMIWLQLNGMHAPYREIAQRMTARRLIEEAALKRETGDALLSVDNLRYQRKTTALNPEQGLYEIMITVWSAEDHILMRRAKIVKFDAQ